MSVLVSVLVLVLVLFVLVVVVLLLSPGDVNASVQVRCCRLAWCSRIFARTHCVTQRPSRACVCLRHIGGAAPAGFVVFANCGRVNRRAGPSPWRDHHRGDGRRGNW